MRQSSTGLAAAAIFAFFLIKHFCWDQKLSPELAKITKGVSSDVASQDVASQIIPKVEMTGQPVDVTKTATEVTLNVVKDKLKRLRKMY